jgi:hypothetical protein
MIPASCWTLGAGRHAQRHTRRSTWLAPGSRLQYPALSAMVLLSVTRAGQPCAGVFWQDSNIRQHEACSEVLQCKWPSNETSLS